MVPFVYLASLCWSLQCPISALTQAGRGGLLFRFVWSAVLYGGRGSADNVTSLCGEHLQCSGHTGFAPAQRCVLSSSTLLRLPAALYGVGPPLHAVPVLGYSTKAWTRLGLRFVPSPARAAQAARSLTSALSPGVIQLLTSAVPVSVSMGTSRVCAPCVCSPELASSHDPPSTYQPSRISGSLWLETGSLFAVW